MHNLDDVEVLKMNFRTDKFLYFYNFELTYLSIIKNCDSNGIKIFTYAISI